MQKKSFIYYSLLASLLFQTTGIPVFAQDDTESVSEVETEEVQDENQETTTEEDAESLDLLAINEVDLEEGNPLSLIEALQAQPRYVSNGFNFLEAINEDEFAVRSIGYVRDGGQYYLMQSAPNAINSSVLIETNEGEFQRSLITSDDLMASMAEGLNNYPDLYAGTVVEEFYQYAQANSDEISGLMIDNQYATADHQQLFDEIRAVDDFFLTSLARYFENDDVAFTVVDSEIGDIYYYEVTAENQEAFQTVLLAGQEDYPELEELFNFFNQSFTGSIAISMTTGSISLSMINEEESNAIEYLIGLDQLAIAQPTDEQIVTADEFNDMIGLELFSSLDEIEETDE